MIMAPEAKYSEKLEVVTKEIEICKFLTSNDSKVRKRGIASLKKWFREIGQKERKFSCGNSVTIMVSSF